MREKKTGQEERYCVNKNYSLEGQDTVIIFPSTRQKMEKLKGEEINEGEQKRLCEIMENIFGAGSTTFKKVSEM